MSKHDTLVPFERAHTSWWKRGSELHVLFLNIALVILTLLSWREYHIQSNTAQRALELANKNLELTEHSVQLEAQQFRQSRRPWILFKGLSIPGNLVVGQPGLFIATLTNPTQYIAFDVRAEGELKIGSVVDDSDLGRIERPYTGASTVIGPENYFQVPVRSVPLGAVLVDEITSGEIFVSYFGKATFSDEFGAKHEIYWCGQYSYDKSANNFDQQQCSVDLPKLT